MLSIFSSIAVSLKSKVSHAFALDMKKKTMTLK